MLDPQPGESIYDPACGSGGMLVETINSVRAHRGATRTLRLYGQEVNLTTAAIAKMNLFLHEIEDFKIVRGDTLRSPGLRRPDGTISQFDVVIANPPFSLSAGSTAGSGCSAPPATGQRMLSSPSWSPDRPLRRPADAAHQGAGRDQQVLLPAPGVAGPDQQRAGPAPGRRDAPPDVHGLPDRPLGAPAGPDAAHQGYLSAGAGPNGA